MKYTTSFKNSLDDAGITEEDAKAKGMVDICKNCRNLNTAVCWYCEDTLTNPTRYEPKK